MLGKISSTNFQSHLNTEINLSPGVNVIKGQSNSGKSSIVRFLRWAILNRPSGFGFKSNFSNPSDVTSVDISFLDSSHHVERERDNKQNRYVISRQGKDGFYDNEEFEALRGDVPREISDVLMMDERNISCQHDGYFLLNDSAGDVAKKLNSVVGLDIIDRMISDVSSSISSLSRDVKTSELAISALEEDVKGYGWVDKIAPLMKKVEKGIEEILSIQIKKDEMARIISLAKEYKEKIAKCEGLLEAEKNVRRIEDLLSLIDVEEMTRKKMIEIVGNLKSQKKNSDLCTKFLLSEKKYNLLIKNSNKIISLEEEVSKIKTLYFQIIDARTKSKLLDEFLKKEKKYSSCLELACRVDFIEKERNLLSSFCEKISGLRDEKEVLEKKEKMLERKFKESFPDICPLCGTNLLEKK